MLRDCQKVGIIILKLKIVFSALHILNYKKMKNLMIFLLVFISVFTFSCEDEKNETPAPVTSPTQPVVEVVEPIENVFFEVENIDVDTLIQNKKSILLVQNLEPVISGKEYIAAKLVIKGFGTETVKVRGAQVIVEVLAMDGYTIADFLERDGIKTPFLQENVGNRDSEKNWYMNQFGYSELSDGVYEFILQPKTFSVERNGAFKIHTDLEYSGINGESLIIPIRLVNTIEKPAPLIRWKVN